MKKLTLVYAIVLSALIGNLYGAVVISPWTETKDPAVARAALGINVTGSTNIGYSTNSGRALTADKLTTARNINGVPFDGTTNITVTASDPAWVAASNGVAYAVDPRIKRAVIMSDTDITGWQPNLANYDAFPGIVKLPNGTLLLVYRNGTNHLDYGTIVKRTSTDQGTTWSAASTVIADPLDARDPSITLLQNSNLVLNYFKFHHDTNDVAYGGTTGPWINISTDNGATWGIGVNIGTIAGAKVASAVSSPAVELSSNHLALAWYGNASTALSDVLVSTSANGGATWTQAGGITNGNIISEPNLAYLSGTTLLMTYRDETTTNIMRSTSTDGGVTWNTPNTLWYGTASPRLFKSSTGLIYCFYRALKPTGEVWTKYDGGMAWRVSQNEGVSWSYENGFEWSGLYQVYDYASACEVTPGVIGVAYALHYVAGTPSKMFFKTMKDSYSLPSAQLANVKVTGGNLTTDMTDIRIKDGSGYTDILPGYGRLTISPSVGVTIKEAVGVNGPTLGVGTGPLAVVSPDGLYGLWMGVSLTGDAWFQAQRGDSVTVPYRINLNPEGGEVAIGVDTLAPVKAMLTIGTPTGTNYGLAVTAGTDATAIDVTGRSNGEGVIAFRDNGGVTEGSIGGTTNKISLYDKDGVARVIVSNSLVTINGALATKGPIADVTAFGAVGDGVSVESAQIQAAIDAGHTTYIPYGASGVYILGATLKLPSNHLLILDQGVRLMAAAALNAPLVQNSDTNGGNHDIEIRGGTFDGNATEQTLGARTIDFMRVTRAVLRDVIVARGYTWRAGIYLDDAGITLQECDTVDILNCKSVGHYGTGLFSWDSTHINVNGGVYVSNSITAIDLTTSPYSSVKNVYAAYSGSSGISMNGQFGIVSGCVAEWNQFGINVGHASSSLYSADYTTVIGNIARHNTNGIQIQATTTVGVQVVGNTSEMNTNGLYASNYIIPAGLHKTTLGGRVGIRNENPGADLQIGGSFNTIPANTAVAIEGGATIRWMAGDNNADYGGYIRNAGGGVNLDLGLRSASVDIPYISMTNNSIVYYTGQGGIVTASVYDGAYLIKPSTTSAVGTIFYGQNVDGWTSIGVQTGGQYGEDSIIKTRYGLVYYQDNSGLPAYRFSGNDLELWRNLYIITNRLSIGGLVGNTYLGTTDGNMTVEPSSGSRLGMIVYGTNGYDGWVALGAPTSSQYPNYGHIVSKYGMVFYPNNIGTPALNLNGVDAELRQNLYIITNSLNLSGGTGNINMSVAEDGEFLMKPTTTTAFGVIVYDADVSNWIALGCPKSGTIYDGWAQLRGKAGLAIFDNYGQTTATIAMTNGNSVFAGDITAASGTIKSPDFTDVQGYMAIGVPAGVTTINGKYNPGGADAIALAIQTGGTNRITITRDGVIAGNFPAGIATEAAHATNADNAFGTTSVLSYGAVGNGIADDTAAVQAALNDSVNIFFPAGTYLVGNLTLGLNNTRLQGVGLASILKLKPAVTGALLSTGIKAVYIDHLTFFGGDDTSKMAATSAAADRSGISIWTQTNSAIHNITVHGFENKGILTADYSNRDFIPHVVISDSSFYNNYIGIECGPNFAEYIKLTSLDICFNGIGIYISSGNVSVSNSKITQNRTGVYVLGTGIDNNAHGNVTGSLINHNTYSIQAHGATNGFNFSGNCIYEGTIYVTYSTGVLIQNGILNVGYYYFKGGGTNIIRNNFSPTTYLNSITHNYEGVTDYTKFIDNVTDIGTYLDSTKSVLEVAGKAGIGKNPLTEPASAELQVNNIALGNAAVDTAAGVNSIGIQNGDNNWNASSVNFIRDSSRNQSLSFSTYNYGVIGHIPLYLNYDGSVSIGSSSITAGYTLNVDGNTRVGGNFVATGTITSSAIITAKQAALANTPTLGTASGSLASTSTDGKYGIWMGQAGSGNTWIQAQRSDGNTAVYDIGLQPSGGSVGVGTLAPHTKLEVYGTSGAPVATGTALTYGNARFANASGVALDFGNFSTSPYAAWLQVHDAADMSVNYPISLNPNGGYVGINKANPATALDITGSATVSGDFMAGSYGSGMVGNYDSTKYRGIYSIGSSYIPAKDGSSIAGMYGLVMAYPTVTTPLAKAGLSHQVLLVENGAVKSAIGTGIWTDGGVTATGDVIVGGQIILTNSIWDDVQVPGLSVKTGTTAPTLGNFVDAATQCYLFQGASADDQCWSSVQLPHSYKQGSNVRPHIHWTPTTGTAGNNVVWELTYTWQNIGSAFVAGTTIKMTNAVPAAAWTHTVSAFPEIAGSGKNISSIMSFRLRRLANGDAADTYTDSAAFLQFDLHYQKDTLGSVAESAK